VYRYGRQQVISTTGANGFVTYEQHIEAKDDEFTIRANIDTEVRRHGEKFEWYDDGSLSVTYTVPIVRKHQRLQDGAICTVYRLRVTTFSQEFCAYMCHVNVHVESVDLWLGLVFLGSERLSKERRELSANSGQAPPRI
jgi:hypothetical protein